MYHSLHPNGAIFLVNNSQRFGGRCLFVLLCLKYTHTLRLMHAIFTINQYMSTRDRIVRYNICVWFESNESYLF